MVLLGNWRPAVHDDAERPDVDLVTVAVAAVQHFRGDVIGRAAHRARTKESLRKDR